MGKTIVTNTGIKISELDFKGRDLAERLNTFDATIQCTIGDKIERPRNDLQNIQITGTFSLINTICSK